MSDEEGEFEVESIQEARIDKGKGKHGKSYWQFRVRWKGFSPEDDTWEPLDSFDDPEIINTFWARCKDSRDVRDIKKFKAGERFLPRGPPVRKLKDRSISHVEGPSQDATPSHVVVPPPPRDDSPILLDISDLPLSKGKRGRGLVDATFAERPTKRHHREERPASSPGQKSSRKADTRFKARAPSSRQQGSSRRNPRDPSPEIVPDSDEEVEQAMQLDRGFNSEGSPSLQDTFMDHGPAPPSPPASASPMRKSPHDPLFDEESDSQTLSRRLRARKPATKTYDNPTPAKRDGQLSAKSRAAAPKRSEPLTAGSSKQQEGTSVQTRQRPGPGRSSSGLSKKSVASLLTGTKGSLKSIKGSYRRTTAQVPKSEPAQHADPTPEPEAPGSLPTAEELLNLAGFDGQDAQDLPDFEESQAKVVGATSESNRGPSLAQDEQASELAKERAESLNKAKESLFPASAISLEQPVPWKRPTIFGPLTAEKQFVPSLPMEADANKPNHSLFFLNLDASTCVPVLFTEVVPGGDRLAPDIHVTHKSPPGYFYTPEVSGALLDAVRSLGTAGRVLVRSDASSDLKEHFLKFSQRLQIGDLFIAPAGVQLYAFCSSDSNLLCSRMNISPGLQALEGQVLVCRIVVDNFSGYAEVVAKADASRLQWSPSVLI